MSHFVSEKCSSACGADSGLLADIFLRVRRPDSTARGTPEMPSDLQLDYVVFWLLYPGQQRAFAAKSSGVKGTSYPAESRAQAGTDECVVLRAPVTRLWRYIEEAQKANSVAADVAAAARQMWTKLSAATGNQLPLPDACPGPDGDLLYTWDRGDHHLEVEIELGTAPTAFYWNRRTGETWEADLEESSPVPEEVLSRLKVFLSHPR